MIEAGSIESKRRKSSFSISTGRYGSGACGIAVLMIVGWLSLAMAVWAACEVRQDTVNILTMNSCRNEIIETYVEPDYVDPSQEVSKMVRISNTGTVDTIVRVSLQRQFGTKLSDGSFFVDETLDPQMIVLNLGTKWWMEKDGYYYYRDILKAGEITKEPLLTSYRLSEKAGNEYQGKEARIVVKMESMQAGENAASVWNVTYQELGIAAPASLESTDTRVTYLGKKQGFTLEEGQTDLFANFKDLLPGCARTQKILLENRSDEEVELFLKAESTEQEQMSEEQQKLVQQLLQKYAVIEIKDGDRILYRGCVSGNLFGVNSSLREYLSLGKVAAGKSKELTVELSLDPDMDNRYMELTGKVKWVFAVQGEDQKSEASDKTEKAAAAIYPAKTGVDQHVSLCLILFLAGMALSIICLYYRRKLYEEDAHLS